MHATAGDQLVQHGRTVGQDDKVSEILQVMGGDETPIYRVRFEDGHEALIAPGSDCVIRHHPEAPRR